MGAGGGGGWKQVKPGFPLLGKVKYVSCQVTLGVVIMRLNIRDSVNHNT